METDVIKREFDKDVQEYIPSAGFTKGASGVTIGILKKSCRDDSEYRLVLKALTGKTSTTQMSEAEKYALWKFVKPTKPEGEKWMSARENEELTLTSMINALVRSTYEQAGQTTLPL